MKNIVFLIIVLLMSSALFSQIKVENTTYKFQIDYSKGWKAGNKVETDKKDVINYSFTKSDKMTSSIIAFRFTVQTNIDDLIYKLEKDFSLNIPEKTNGYKNLSGEVYEGKSAEYKDNETIEKIYFYTTTKDSAGEYYCYMIRFIADSKYNKTNFDTEVTNIAGTFKINL